MPDLDRLQETFANAQQAFDGRLDEVDRSALTRPADAVTTAELIESAPEAVGFYPIDIDLRKLQGEAALFVGRTLLIANNKVGALSPAIITADPDTVGNFQMTRLDQPYDPRVGFSEGQHFALSAKAQTRVKGYGAHGHGGGLEQGHFSAVLLGVRQPAFGEKITNMGDAASHAVINAGSAEVFAQNEMMDVAYTTTVLPTDVDRPLRVYWHEKLPDFAGDYPGAVNLMLGAGLAAIGDRAVDDARRLVDDAVRGVS